MSQNDNINYEVDTIIGLDLSLNGPGFCSMDLKTGCTKLCGFVSTTKKFTTLDPKDLPELSIIPFGSYLRGRMKKNKSRPEDENPDVYNAYRRAFIFKCWRDFLNKHVTEHTIVIQEDYAYSSTNAGIMELAEVSGLIRDDLWQRRIALRLHDPMSVKMWACSSGSAKKRHMRLAAAEKKFRLADVFFGEKKAKNIFEFDGNYEKTDLSGPGADVVDAWHLADFGRGEILTRMNYNLDLTKKQLNEFVKVSKANPVALLERPFIYRTEDYDIS